MPKIFVNCHHELDCTRNAVFNWTELWIQFRDKPGRREYSYGIDLASKALDRLSQNAQNDPAIEDDEYSRERQSRKERARLSLQLIESGQKHVVLGDGPVFEILTSKDYIDRKEAEEMLTFLLISRGHRVGRFIWRAPKHVYNSQGEPRTVGWRRSLLHSLKE